MIFQMIRIRSVVNQAYYLLIALSFQTRKYLTNHAYC